MGFSCKFSLKPIHWYMRLTVAITTMAISGPDTFLLRGRHRAQSAAGPARRCPGVNGHQLQKRYINIYSISYHIISYLSTNIYTYVYIYIYIHMCIHMCIYIYIYQYTRGTWMYMVSAHGNTIKHNTIRPSWFFLECHTCSPGISWEHDAFGFLPDLDFCMHSFNPFLLGYLGIIIYLQPQVSPAILLS